MMETRDQVLWSLFILLPIRIGGDSVGHRYLILPSVPKAIGMMQQMRRQAGEVLQFVIIVVRVHI